MVGNEFGQAKIFDPRSNTVEPVQILDVGEPAISVLSIAQHPGRTHLILGGCSDGNLTLWDVRKGTDEPLVVARHEGAILDVSDQSESVTQAYETIIAVNYNICQF